MISHKYPCKRHSLRISVRGLFFMLLQMIFLTAGHAQTQQSQFAPAMRDLWTPGSVRFLKHWIMLGPVPGDWGGTREIFPSVAPVPGAKQTIGGRSLVWQPQFSWTDIVDLPSLLNTPAYRGTAAAPEIAFAYTTITRDEASDAVLSIAGDQPLRVWLNGKQVFAVRAPRTFLFDQDRVPVRLLKGENRLLVELSHRTGSWRFAIRFLSPGQIIAPVAEITPAVVGGAQGELRVRSDITPDNPGAPVEVTAVAPDGTILARSEAARGATVSFATASWPDGPYEVRFATRTAWGENAVVHLPQYKGDARQAARTVLDEVRTAPAGAPGATQRMLADLIRDRLGDDPHAAPDDSWPLVHAALMEYAEQRQQGAIDAARPYGFVRLAYTDEIDGSTQFCRAYLPPHYTPQQKWPAVVMLHGFNPPNPAYVGWWGVDKRHDETADKHDVIFLEPMGRGNTQYLGIGEQDVLRCLAEAKRRFSVDNDRVYLMGESMGGAGTWLIASHNPELFAAAAPLFGGWEYRIIPGGGYDNPKADQPPERYVAQYQSSFAGAESLSNMPMLVTHGDNDQSVPADFSRFAATMLQRWNYNLRYQEIPGMGHEDLDLRDKVVSWLLTHRRNPAPHQVHIRALELDHAGAYWARIVSFEQPLHLMEADAEVLRPGLVRLDTRNVAAIHLSLPAELRGAAALRVIWNGRTVAATAGPDSGVLLQATGDTLAPGDKRPGREGGISNIITTPFVVVIGTASSDPKVRALCQEKANAFARQWMAWQHVLPRLIRDDELTASDEQRYSLLLVGGADANLVSRRLMPRLPLRIDTQSVAIDGKRFVAPDSVVQMIYPNPAQPARYVLVVAATSDNGLNFWDPAGLWQTPLGFPLQPLDWSIRDGRIVNLPYGLSAHRGAVASGVFNRHWRMEDRNVFRGDESLRSASPLRHPVSAGLAPSTDEVKALTGHYQLLPGVIFDLHPEGSTLLIITPDGMKNVLTQESQGVFVVGVSTLVVRIVRDAQGGVTGLDGNNNGTQWQANKLD